MYVHFAIHVDFVEKEILDLVDLAAETNIFSFVDMKWS